LGNTGYACTPYLMMPYPSPSTAAPRTLQHCPHKDKSDCGAVLWAMEG